MSRFDHPGVPKTKYPDRILPEDVARVCLSDRRAFERAFPTGLVPESEEDLLAKLAEHDGSFDFGGAAYIVLRDPYLTEYVYATNAARIEWVDVANTVVRRCARPQGAPDKRRALELGRAARRKWLAVCGPAAARAWWRQIQDYRSGKGSPLSRQT